MKAGRINLDVYMRGDALSDPEVRSGTVRMPGLTDRIFVHRRPYRIERISASGEAGVYNLRIRFDKAKSDTLNWVAEQDRRRR